MKTDDGSGKCGGGAIADRPGGGQRQGGRRCNVPRESPFKKRDGGVMAVEWVGPKHCRSVGKHFFDFTKIWGQRRAKDGQSWIL